MLLIRSQGKGSGWSLETTLESGRLLQVPPRRAKGRGARGKGWVVLEGREAPGRPQHPPGPDPPRPLRSKGGFLIQHPGGQIHGELFYNGHNSTICTCVYDLLITTIQSMIILS